MPLDRRQLLWASGAAALAALLPKPRPARAAAVGTPKNLIVVWAGGGWDTSYAIDPKPPGGGVDVPAEADAQIVLHGNLDVLESPARPSIGGFFARYAPITAVVRGIRLNDVSHEACARAMLTGARNETSPDVAAIVANGLAPGLPLPYLVLGDQAFAGPYAASMGRVGATNQIVGLLAPRDAYPIDGVARDFAPNVADEPAIRAYANARIARERAVRGARGYNKRRVDDFAASLERGDRLRELKDSLGDRGTQLDLAGQRALAIEALSTGVSQTVMMSSQLFWDTHEVNTAQSLNHERLFSNLLALVDGLAARAGQQAGHTMLDETVIAVMSEMGRTPKLNGDQGKDHWPVTSAMVIGTDLVGGRAFGGTSSTGEAEKLDFATGAVSATGKSLETKNVVAGLLGACGIDPANHLPDAEVFDAFVG